MKPIVITDLMNIIEYEKVRNDYRSELMDYKKMRRISLGPNITITFENRKTMKFQIQEMMRVERIVKEEDILHEIKTYNEILGKPGELGCTLMIEIDDPFERDDKLSKWLDLPKYLYLKLDDETKIMAKFDKRQIGETRLSSVQYIKFNTKGKVPIAIGSDFPSFKTETLLSSEQKNALNEDLK